jgi:hypothetical protein
VVTKCKEMERKSQQAANSKSTIPFSHALARNSMFDLELAQGIYGVICDHSGSATLTGFVYILAITC